MDLPVLFTIGTLDDPKSALKFAQEHAHSLFEETGRVDPFFLLTPTVAIPALGLGPPPAGTVLMGHTQFNDANVSKEFFSYIIRRMCRITKASVCVFASESWHAGEATEKHYYREGMTPEQFRDAMPENLEDAVGVEELVMLVYETVVGVGNHYQAPIQTVDGKRHLGDFKALSQDFNFTGRMASFLTVDNA